MALLIPVAVAAQASAATLSVNQNCFVNTTTERTLHQAPMVVTGSGYVPGDSVTITSSDGSVNTVTQAGPAGTIGIQIGAPTPFLKLPGSQVVGLTASDDNASGTITGGTFLKTTLLDVATVPSTAPPSRRVSWYFSGFRPGRPIYVHYLHRGRQVARVRFGEAKGVCGLLRTRARFFPGRQRYQRYGLQFDDSKRYSKRSRPRLLNSLVRY
ncbi:MAG: hypothetical protein ABI323_09425 [Solirubrobacteraceae bacterium]